VHADVLATLRLLATDDADEVISVVAAYLADRLGKMDRPVPCVGRP
jgi:hypothetical protein